jgi:lipopolysaccharide/colanic/teichoic acid biosynthesis glycosyltransferase
VLRAWDALQRGTALLAALFLLPLMGVIAVIVRMSSPGPALYVATRVSRGRPFHMYKFRTMKLGIAGPAITAAGDPRITRVGEVLRRSKLDELPQLWNVVAGDMLLVGPRPEDPRYVDFADPQHRLVFGARPGITGPTALSYRDEERLLAEHALEFAQRDGRAQATSADVEDAYRTMVLPAKLRSDVDYLERRSIRGDIEALSATLRVVLSRG